MFSNLSTPSIENKNLLEHGKVDFALVQSGAFKLGSLSVISPLYYENVIVVVKKDSQIEGIQDLNHRVVNIEEILWTYLKNKREEHELIELSIVKERLDALLLETVKVEEEQIGERHPEKLDQYLQALSAINKIHQ